MRGLVQRELSSYQPLAIKHMYINSNKKRKEKHCIKEKCFKNTKKLCNGCVLQAPLLPVENDHNDIAYTSKKRTSVIWISSGLIQKRHISQHIQMNLMDGNIYMANYVPKYHVNKILPNPNNQQLSQYIMSDYISPQQSLHRLF